MGGILGLDTVDVPYYKIQNTSHVSNLFWYYPVVLILSGCLVIKNEKNQGVKIVQLGTGPPD